MVVTKLPHKLETPSDVRLIATSIPGRKRPAYLPTVLILSAAWLMTAALIVAGTIGVIQHGPLSWLAVLWVVMGVVIAGFLTAFTGSSLVEFDRNYVLEFTDREMRLKILESRSGPSWVVRMPWFEVAFVEHFSPADRASLVFHGAGERTIEVPVWTMTENVNEILAFLEKKKIWIERL